MRLSWLSLAFGLLFAAPAFPQADRPAPARVLELQQAPALTAFTDLGGQMYGAGANGIVQIDEGGRPVRTFPARIARPSLAPHDATHLLVGDGSVKTLSLLDTRTGILIGLLKLDDVRDNSAEVPGGHLLHDGALAGVASDGKQVFVAMQAGFSSAIFKIDPASRKIVARGWAAAADPQGMAFHNGALFVLTGNGTQLRRFNERLQRSRETIALPTAGGRGLGIRAGEVLTLVRGQVHKAPVPAAELTLQAAVRRLDQMVLQPDKLRPVWKWPLNLSKRVAVLICGDLAENFSGECFWNDTVWMYKTLLANGYKENDIFVLYGDGADYLSANPAYRHPTRVTDFAATSGNVNLVFDGLKNGDPARSIPKLDSNDSLFVWTFDHGGRTSGGVSTLCLRDGQMLATSFAAKANAVTYGKRAFFMQQCFSGGFIDPLKNAKTFISTAARYDQVAYPADTENEVVGGRSYSHGEYNYWITCALNRLTPTGAAVNADANADAWIAMAEMHAWEAGHKSTSETPQSNDMGGVGGSFRMKK